MSNFLAIATVTATLQRVLQGAVQIDVSGAQVTTVRPDATGGGTPEVGVNIYLYQASPNPAWRNADLRTRRPKGDLIKQAQAGLDLYYLMTFYGNEVELEPQRLLGSTVRTLVDQPILTSDMIRETINHPNFTYLQESTLSQQVEQVAIVPTTLSTDDLSKIWSVFFQTPYMLSFAFQGGAVLIEGERSGGRGLPVRSRQFYSTANQPVIERVLTAESGNPAIVAESTLLIRGQRLGAEVSLEQLQTEERQANRFPETTLPQRRWQPSVQIGDARLTPQRISAQEVELRLSVLSAEERAQLRAGVQSLHLTYPLIHRVADIAVRETSPLPEHSLRTNTLPLVLCPTIADAIQVHGVRREGEQILTAEVSLTVDLLVDPEQRVFLMLNQRATDKPAAYIFAAQRRSEATRSLAFTVRSINAGDYLVRLQIDGAESLLEYDGVQYIRPHAEIR